jgi:hypothetical protein
MLGLRTMATEQVPKGGCAPHTERDWTIPELDLGELPEELNLGTYKKSMVSFPSRGTGQGLQRAVHHDIR